jgi:ABC-2 type transport system permease protein
VSAPGVFAPRPGAAPLGRMVLAQGRMETRLLLRNGEQLLLAAVIPLLVLLAGAFLPITLGPGQSGVVGGVLVPGVLALAVMSTAFTSLAIATGFERRYGVLKRFGASPLPRHGLLAGKALAVSFVELLQIVAIGVAGLLLGWRPELSPVRVLSFVLLVLVGTVAFASLALLMAGVLRAEATLAAANLVYLVLLIAGATVLPASEYPGFLAGLTAWLPSGALAEGMRSVFLPGTGLAWVELGVLALWALVAGLLTARTFRWD